MGEVLLSDPVFEDNTGQLNSIGISLSKEKDFNRLLEIILHGAQAITNADAGTIYLREDTRHFRFEVMSNNSIDGFHDKNDLHAAKNIKADKLPNIHLYLPSGKVNLKTVTSYVANTGKTININDAYTEKGFDFSGTKSFDRQNGYRSKSFLAVPLVDHENEIIGVLQLINAIDPKTKKIVSFSAADQLVAESLASQAAIILSNHLLIKQLKGFLEIFIKIIAEAIDDKSPYTGGHCRRVPDIAMLIATSINDADSGPHKNTNLSNDELYELKIAALLHDCGKISTPAHIADKSTKLETVFDRIALVELRFQSYKKSLKVKLLESKIEALTSGDHTRIKSIERAFATKIKNLDADFTFLKQSNFGSEGMSQVDLNRIKTIGKYSWTDEDGNNYYLLTKDEIYNLSTTKGSLTKEEREVLNGHIVSTQKMLMSMPFPKHLRNVPAIAGNHHERIDGKGYPNQLKGSEMSIQSRLMCIADIFEALTAADRPYKKSFSLTESLHILGKMSLSGHIDPDLFDVFVRQKVYQQYADNFDYLSAEQIDAVDQQQIPGFRV